MMVVAPLSARDRRTDRHQGGRRPGLASASCRSHCCSMLQLEASTAYANIFWRLMLMAVGHGSHDGARRPSRSWARCHSPRPGVGSAVNDTTRQVGGALGVAIIGSVLVVDVRRKVAGDADRRPVRSRASRPRRALARVRARDRGSASAGPRGERSQARPGTRSSTGCTTACSSAAAATARRRDRRRAVAARARARRTEYDEAESAVRDERDRASPRRRHHDTRLPRPVTRAPGRPRSVEADEVDPPRQPSSSSASTASKD